METDETQMSKRTRMSNGGGGSYEAAARKEQQDEDEEDGEGGGGKASAAAAAGTTSVRFLAWQQQLQLQHQQLSHASRICRVSRASGGKDRHSKVFTAKGLRDRRVRLSVPTAIQFYDLQDRLGYDQPSKAVEWLIKAASAAIAELPSLDAAFAQLPGQLTDGKFVSTGAGSGGADERTAGDHDSTSQQQQLICLTKSACSSNSDTSKGSVLSLSRSESRVKARERAKERATTKERDKGGQENGDNHTNHGSAVPSHHHHQTVGLNSHSSFTELLTFGVGGGGGSNHTHSPLGILQAYSGEGATAAVHKQIRHFPPAATTADYFGQANSNNPYGQGQKPHHQPAGFTAMPHFTTSPTIGMLPFNVTTAVAANGGSSDHPEIHQQYPFLQDHLIPTAVASGGDYGNLSFSISSGLAGFNRGTLQSNSTSSMPHLQHLQRLSSSQVDGTNLPFFFGAVAQPASAPGENPFAAGFDARLQLCYGDAYRSSDLKGKEKN